MKERREAVVRGERVVATESLTVATLPRVRSSHAQNSTLPRMADPRKCVYSYVHMPLAGGR